ncbi:hypothetical protein BC831DRAFT_463273 [Entophlyctis helioformis]|nr:hypothetical protein BC831DRAFT_463273 [Entophlyctis helioformis]
MPKNPAAPDEEQQPQPPSVTSAPHLGITNLATFTASTESVGQQSKDSQDSHDSQDSKESGATTQRSESPGILHSARAYLASRKQGSGRRQWFGNPFSASPTCATPAQTQGAVHDQTLVSQPSLALGNVHGAVEDLASPIANSPGKDVTSTHPVQPPVSAHAKSPSIDSVDSASMFGTVREAHASQPRALSMPSLYSRLSALPGYEGDSQAQGEEQPSETDLDVDPDRKQQYHHQQPAEQQAAVRTGVRVPPTRRLRQ